MTEFDQLFNDIESTTVRPFVLEFGQSQGKKKYLHETVIMLPSSFDITKPFMFKLTENLEGTESAYGYSDLDKVLKKK